MSYACPICASALEPMARYPRYVCERCGSRVKSVDGRPLGFELDWMELPERHQSRIVSWRSDSPLQQEHRWDEYADWMTDQIIRMDAVFRPLVKALP